MNTFVGNNGNVLRNVRLILGEDYILRRSGKQIRVKMIKVTKLGYNFLHEPSAMCVLPRHMFVPKKKLQHSQGPIKSFVIPADWRLHPCRTM